MTVLSVVGGSPSVVGKIQEKAINFLVDTGSAITIVSSSASAWLNLGDMELKTVPYDVRVADGQVLNVHGQCELEITLGPLKVSHLVVVADISQEAILGMDFLSEHECKIDLPRSLLSVNGIEVNMWRENETVPSVCRVALKCDELIPANHEQLVSARVIRRGSEARYNIVEPSSLFRDRTGIMLGRSLVDISSGSLVIRLCNPSDEDIELKGGMTLGVCEPIVECIPGPSPEVTVNNVGIGDQANARGGLPPKLQDMLDRSSVNLTPDQVARLKHVLLQYCDVFVGEDGTLGRTDYVKHKIDTQGARPVKQKLRRTPMHLHEEVDKVMEDMIDRKIISPSASPWQANVVLVKKRDGSLRFCIDYRGLNKVTVKDSYRIPSISESLDLLSGASMYSCCDLASSYWQVEIESEDKHKTAFATSRHGLYEFNVMPFGLCNAAGTFERLMENVLSGLQFEILLIYLDDVIVPCKDFDEGLERLSIVFTRFRQAGLKLKPSKCSLFQKEVIFLGHKVSEQGIETDPDKISAVKNWPTPTSVTEVRSFMGFCSYYRKFIKDFAAVARPLHKLTEINTKFVWSEACEKSFQGIKNLLIEAPILAYPSMDATFILDTDASNEAIGAVLSQVQDGQERAIAYGSKSLHKAERNYCVTRRELLAIVYFVKYYKHYLYGKKFLVRTDHGALRWLFGFKDPIAQVARWLETLAMFDFDIEHRPGRLHGNADGLSRIPCRQCGWEPEDSPPCVLAVTRSQTVRETNENSRESDAGQGVPDTYWLTSWTNERLRESQLSDPLLSKVIKLFERPVM